MIHLHTRYSDGDRTVPDIAAAAAGAAVDVVLITDHDTLAARVDEGWHGDVLVLAGVELNPKRRDHYLAFGIEAVPSHDGLSAAEMCDVVWRAGGFGFAAQPQRWADLESPRFTGIEVWNAASAQPRTEALEAWDQLAAQRRVVGIAGVDGHRRRFSVRPLTLSLPGYARLFRHVRTHVQTEATLAGVLDYDRKLVFNALRAGRCYMAVDKLAPATGFRFELEDNGTTILPMGAEGSRGGCQLVAELPTAAELTLLRDGQTIAARSGDSLTVTADKRGAYRLEARIRGALWILSNPIYLR